MRGPDRWMWLTRTPVTARPRWFSALVVFGLLVSLLSPLMTTVVPAAAAPGAQRQGGTPPPLPAPSRVNVAGSFQAALGCPGDYDKTCQLTDLSDDDQDGVWTGFFAIPAGSYTFRVVASSDIDRSLGEGGDPDATDISLQVPDTALGVYFSYDTLTGEIVAEPADHEASIATDLGQSYPLAPVRRGYEVYFDGPAGTYGYTINLDGQPVGSDTVALDVPSRVHIVVDPAGATLVKETVDSTLVQVVKTAAGQPQPGACFAILQRDGTLVGQACDAADGQEDGNVTIRIANGVEAGSYTVTETLTPDGQTAAPDQRTDLGPGQFQVEATADAGQTSAGDETPAGVDQTPAADQTVEADETPVTDETPGSVETPTAGGEDAAAGRLVVVSVASADPQGDHLSGACYLLDFAVQACDDDADGDVVFDGVAPGTHSLTETTAPDGYLGVPDAQFDLGVDGGRLEIPHDASDGGGGIVPDGTQPAEPTTAPEATEAPAATISPDGTETPGAGTGSLEVTTQTADGQAVDGACFSLTSRDQSDVAPVERCDDADGSVDGQIRFDDLAAGTYRLDESTTPDGVQPASGQRVEIAAGDTTRLTVTYQAAAATTGTLVILVEDEDGAPVGETCFTLKSDIASFDEICDQGNDGRLNFPDMPAAEYTVTQTQTADGHTVAAEQAVTVPAGDSKELTVVNPSSESDTGTVTITATDAIGDPVAGDCYTATGETTGQTYQVCDNADGDLDVVSGVVTIESVVPDTYQIAVQPADPAEAAPAPETVEVSAAKTASVTFTAAEAATATDVPVATAEATATEAATATEEPIATAEPIATEETAGPTATVEAAGGSVLVIAADQDGGRIDGLEVQLDGPATVGPVTDAQDGDADARAGRLLLENVIPGDYTLTVLAVPDGYQTPEPQAVTVADGETARVEVTLTVAPSAAQLTILTVDEDGQPLAGACYSITNPSGTFGPFCDEDNNGDVLLTEVTPGEQTVTQATQPTDGAAASKLTQTITLAEGEQGTLTFTSGPATGAVEITATGPDGKPAAGGCYVLTGPTTYRVCDDEAGSLDAPGFMRLQETTSADAAADQPGVIRIDGIAPGDYTITEDHAPDGFAVATTPQTVTVVAGETATTSFSSVPVPETGTLTVTVVDADGTSIEASPGACVGLTGTAEIAAICDNESGDTDPASGDIGIDAIPAGSFTLTESRAPDGFVAGADVTVEIVAGETATAQFGNDPTTPPTGALVVTIQSPDGSALGAACVSLTGVDGKVCDNDQQDANGDPGLIRVEGLAPATYTVTVTDAPEGYVTGDPADVTVTAGGDASVTLTLAIAPPATGGVRLTVNDANGQPAEGGCVALTHDSDQLGPFCDNNDDDGDPAAGIILLTDLPTGSYEAVQTEPAPAEAQAVSAQQAFTIRANRTIEVIIIIVLPPTTGDLLVVARDERNRLLGDACFAVVGADGGTTTEICDNDGNDGDGNTGSIRFDAIGTGSFTLRETQAPAGYNVVADQDVTIDGGGISRITIRHELIPAATGALTVLSFAEADAALSGGCYALLSGTQTVAGPVCDDVDGDDGSVSFAEVDAGTYLLRETTAPSTDYAGGTDRQVTIVAGGIIEVRVSHARRTGRLFIRKTDESGSPLGGSCFELTPAGGGDGYDLCDDGVSDGLRAPSVLLLDGIVPGDYMVQETVAPSGYQPGEPQQVTIEPGRRASLIFANVPLPPPPTIGNLSVFKVDDAGDALAGACFALRQESVTIAGPRCDGADGANDGTITFTGVGAGDYSLHETQHPAGYESGADQDVTVPANDTAQVTVENRLLRGRVLVRKSDPSGNPLQNACFDLAPDGRGPMCTDASGQVTFVDLFPGSFSLTEVEAPAGYLAVAPVAAVVVRPGATTVLDLVDALAPPPPDTGSIQVLKFYCPAGDQGERTEFIDSSDARNGRLAQTAGCSRGDAQFRLIASSGEGGPGTFNTGADGFYQVTLGAGGYTLDEIAPDLPGDASEAVTIGTDQLTTVVVLNFVAPPAPAPATIGIVKYTCAAGFQGAVFADFVDNCETDAALTNNVTFRLSGQIADRHVTGDGGQKGQTRFTDLAAGTYTLREEQPFEAMTAYAFCGPDPDAPALKAVGATIGLTLAAGDAITCTWFNVPDDLSTTTGAIVVHKQVCDASSYPAGFDWYGKCAAQAGGAQFSLALFEGGRFAPKSTGTVDDNGLLRFSRLQPGTYQLKEIGSTWCHAESDSVNARGDVVVRAGFRANVWIFNCVDTKSPPNTGAGPAARSGGPGGYTAALGLAWPLLAAAGLGWRRRRAA